VRLAVLKLKFTSKKGLCCIRGQAPWPPSANSVNIYSFIYICEDICSNTES
jgi:hypothetical protein